MTCKEPMCLAERSNLLRRLESVQPSPVRELKNKDVINLFDKMTRYKIERNDARRELGEALATIAMLESLIAEHLEE